MSFRMRNTQKPTEQKEKEKEKPPDPPKVYSKEEMDLVESKYKEKEIKMKKFVEEPANPLLEQYRQNLIQKPDYKKETIVYDQNTRKWKLVK